MFPLITLISDFWSPEGEGIYTCFKLKVQHLTLSSISERDEKLSLHMDYMMLGTLIVYSK